MAREPDPEDIIPFASARPAAWAPARRFGEGVRRGHRSAAGSRWKGRSAAAVADLLDRRAVEVEHARRAVGRPPGPLVEPPATGVVGQDPEHERVVADREVV